MGRGYPMASRADQRGLARGAAHLRRIRRGSRAHAHGATMTVSTGTRVPVEETRIALGRPLRVALVHGRDEASRRAVAHLALASGAEIVARIRATDPRSFVEAAQALRDAKPDVVVIQGGPKEQQALAELLEALRLGCGAQRPLPRIFALVDAGVGEVLRPRANPFEFRRFAAASLMVEALRELRRAGDE